MSCLPSENTGGTHCLVLHAPWESAQEHKPNGSYHRGLVIKEHLTPLRLMLLTCGSRNSPYTPVCRQVDQLLFLLMASIVSLPTIDLFFTSLPVRAERG